MCKYKRALALQYFAYYKFTVFTTFNCYIEENNFSFNSNNCIKKLGLSGNKNIESANSISLHKCIIDFVILFMILMINLSYHKLLVLLIVSQ